MTPRPWRRKPEAGSDRPAERIVTGGAHSTVVGGDMRGNALGPASSSLLIENLTLHQVTRWEQPNWPVQVGVIPSPAGYYQHRPESDALAHPGAARCQVVTGTGGVGKTQLAAQHARRARRHPGADAAAGPADAQGRTGVDLTVWVTATNRQAVTAGYASAARVVVPGGAEDTDADDAAQQFLAWLQTTDRPWLVVLDDAPDPGTLAGLWPPETPSGRVLVTTRSRDAAWSTDTRGLSGLGLFSAEQSTAYLGRALARPGHEGRTDEPADLAALAADLGHLPLALAQAAAYLVDTGRSVPVYRGLLAGHARTLAQLLPGTGSLPDTQTRTVDAVWDLSLALADTQRPRGLARPLLELAAVLDPNSVPAGVLTGGAARAFAHRAAAAEAGNPAEADPGTAPDVLDAEDALRVLHRLNLLDHDTADGSVRVHRLLQRAVQEHPQRLTRLSDAVRAGADALTEIWPGTGRDAALVQTLRANTEALESRNTPALWEDGAHPVLFRSGQSLGTSGQAGAAAAHFERLAGTADDLLGPDHPDTRSARHEAAFWRGHTGDTAGALTAFQQLLVDESRAHGPDHLTVLVTRNEIAYLRGESGDLTGAAEATGALVADFERVLGPDHPTTFRVRGNLAGLTARQGDLTGAAAGYETLLRDRLRVLGPDHPDTLLTRQAIADLHTAAGDLKAAIVAHEAVLADRLRVLGPVDPEVFLTRNNLAAAKGYAGDVAGARAGFEALLAEQTAVIGPDHPHTFVVRANIAFWRRVAGDPAGALRDYREVLTDRLRVLGPDHPDTLATRSDLAAVRGESGDPAGAVRDYREVLTDRLRVLGPDHPDTLLTRNNLAGWQAEAGDPAGAAAALEELLTDRLRVHGPHHPDTLMVRHNLAGLLGRTGDPAQAVSAHEALLEAQLPVLGPDHPDTLLTRNNLAGFRADAGDVPTALTAYRQVLADRLRVLGPDHPATFTTRGDLARCLELAGQWEHAVLQHNTLVRDLGRLFGRSDPRTQHALAELGRCFAERSGPPPTP
ncbi:tetratricopeptide repeat protein [Kitasatospora sp. NPDC088391]|uniref:tetratricopeptide repeat protein n=1 Tax=Kitasatospora sp. NPDC088391 TaxID=3364074 RepID=UPI00380929AE